MPDTHLFDPEFVADPHPLLAVAVAAGHPPLSGCRPGTSGADYRAAHPSSTLYPQFTVVEDDVRWAMSRLMVKHIVSLPVIVCR